MGETCVPTNPERVVVLDTSALDAAFALGVKPIGSIKLEDYLSYPENQLNGIVEVGKFEQPNFEKILRLKPDLILDCNQQQIYQRLSQIAPTVSVSVDDCSDNWQNGFKIYAAALGKTTVAAQLLQDYHKRIQEFQRQMGARLKDTEVSVVVFAPEYVRIYLQDSFLGAVIAETGLPRPPAQEKAGFAEQISLETLEFADGDVIFVMDFGPQDSSLSEITTSALWSKLNAVKQGKVYPVTYGSWIAERSIGGANRILDDLFKRLVNAN